MLLSRVDAAAAGLGCRGNGKTGAQPANSRGKLKFIEPIERAVLSHCLIRPECL